MEEDRLLTRFKAGAKGMSLPEFSREVRAGQVKFRVTVKHDAAPGR
jgi:hypothetical protein